MHSTTTQVGRSALTIVLAGLGVLLLAAAPPTAAYAQTVVPQDIDVSGLAWVKTGGPFGGVGYDIRSRTDDPDVMLVTDVNSGLNISVDGGRTWTASNAGIDVRSGPSGDGFSVFSVTIDPHDNDVVWAGTQSRMGIFKSIDGGRTWVRKSNGVAGDSGVSFRGFTVDPINSNIVYAAGEIASFAWNNGVPLGNGASDRTRGMVYKTTDGGEHWTRIWYGDNLARYVWIDPGNRNVLYVSTGIFDRLAANSDEVANVAGGVGILKSTDGGQTWRALNQSNGLGNLYVGSLFMHPTNPSILLAGTGNGIFGAGAGVYLTTDGGERWEKVLFEPRFGGSTEDGFSFGAVEISTPSPDVFYAAAGAAYRSDDGGRTWNRYIYPGSEANPFWGAPGMRAGFPIDLEADGRDPMRVFANLYGGGNLLSTDGGKTWADASDGYTGAMMLSVAVDQNDPAVVYSVARSGVFKSTRRGEDWQGVNSGTANFSSEMATVAVSPANGREVLVSDSMSGKLWKSVDGGLSWDRVLDYWSGIAPGGVPPTSDTTQGFVSIAYAPSNTRIVYTGMGIRTCWVSEPTTSCNTPTYKGVHRSTDGGTTWQVTDGEGLGPQSILALAVHPTNPDVLYAGTSAPGLFKTVNGGRSWVSINKGVSSLYVRSIAIDPSSPETLYVGTGGAAIFKSTDGGASWQSYSAGLLPNAAIWAVLPDPMKPSIVWAASPFTGAYRSEDAGATWVQLNAGLSTRGIRAMALSDDGGTVYAATDGAGVFRLDLPVSPKVRSHPSSRTVAPGGQASFSAAASGTPTPTVRWQVSTNGGSTWSDISGATATTYSCAVAAGDNGNRYRAVFTNNLGSASSNSATLTIYGRRRGVRH